MLFNSFLFMVDFSLGRIAGQHPQDNLEYLTVNSNFREICWLHIKMGPRKVGDAITSPRPWTTSGSLSRGFSQQGLPHQSSVGHSGYLAELT